MNDVDLPTAFKALGDPQRLRLLLLLRREELTVSELTALTGLPQSTVSGMVRTLSDAGLVAARPDGRQTFYRGAPGIGWAEAALGGEGLAPEDEQALADVLRARDGAGAEESEAAPLERPGLPGRSWEALARALLLLEDLGVVADLGVGSGELTLLLASEARRVYAVDRDPAVLKDLARRAAAARVANLVTVRGDFDDPVPLPGPADLVVLSQSLHCARNPGATLRHARDLLRPGGRILVMDLLAHDQEWVRERLGHLHLGFTDAVLSGLLEAAGFTRIAVERGPLDRRPPRFRSLLAVATRPGRHVKESA
ncbi:metalloregulator ArsR/SmtB family transcription factor [Myxococcota bacterium]|nr:metalloregulator ArsR/SmtB family transcription factor [Myxococcota bacterium]